MDEPGQILIRVGWDLLALLGWLCWFLWRWSLLIVAIAWCLWAVDWRKLWSVLAQGAWVPCVLALVTAALIWSRVAPTQGNLLGLVDVPNFWWQLGDVCLVAVVILACGWIQDSFRWAPAEITLEPPAAAAAEHGHH
jgi:hypothetical protein